MLVLTPLSLSIRDRNGAFMPSARSAGVFNIFGGVSKPLVPESVQGYLVSDTCHYKGVARAGDFWPATYMKTLRNLQCIRSLEVLYSGKPPLRPCWRGRSRIKMMQMACGTKGNNRDGPTQDCARLSPGFNLLTHPFEIGVGNQHVA